MTRRILGPAHPLSQWSGPCSIEMSGGCTSCVILSCTEVALAWPGRPGADGKPLGNGNCGILIYYGHDNTIGGPGAGNVISGNQGDGIDIDLPADTGNFVQGNFIGTDQSGTLSLGNTRDGVRFYWGTNDQIGGVAPGQGNTIAHNGADGVDLYSSANSNWILGNSIVDNGDCPGLCLGDRSSPQTIRSNRL